MRAKVHSHLKVQQKMVCADVVWVLQTYSFFARQGSFIYTASFILKGRMKIVCIQIRQNDTIQSWNNIIENTKIKEMKIEIKPYRELKRLNKFSKWIMRF